MLVRQGGITDMICSNLIVRGVPIKKVAMRRDEA